MVVLEDGDHSPSDAALDRWLAAAAGWGAAVVSSEVRDTYKSVRQGRVVETVPRETLVDAHGPWIFDRSVLQRAIARVHAGGQPCRGPVDLARLSGVEVRLLEWSVPE